VEQGYVAKDGDIKPTGMYSRRPCAARTPATAKHQNLYTPQKENTMNTTNLPQERRQRCEVWTRVMGYHRPVSAFNKGKQSEHRERTHFTESASR
jgi:hypothetical protein